ncbi:Chromosome-partitioning protein Spo0J [Phycisphaerae bacterium RAS1]|nr:Chromosome-partitioning protein Spo0J [Phycisphaerae bacterium RAS1]
MDVKAVQNMPLDRVVCETQERKRFDEEPLVGLAQSIAESGVLQPVLVRREGSSFVCVDGERRLRAAKRAGLTAVPVIVEDRELSPADVTLRQTVLNSQRQELTPIERARAFSKLIQESGWTAAEVARRTGFSEATISRLTALLTLPDEVVKRIEAGEIPASTAYQIAIAGDGQTQAKLASEAANGKLSRDRVVERSRRSRRATLPRRVKRPARERFTVRLGPGRSLTVSGPNLTLTSLTAWLQALLTRISTLEPQDMALADAAKALSADASCKGVVS